MTLRSFNLFVLNGLIANNFNYREKKQGGGERGQAGGKGEIVLSAAMDDLSIRQLLNI